MGCLALQALILSSIQQLLLTIYYLSGIILDIGEIAVNNTEKKKSCSSRIHILVGEINNE